MKEADLNGWCTKELFVSDREQDFERERGNQPIGACLPLSLYLFLSSSANIPLPYPFSFFLFFLILVFYFLVFKFLILWCFPCPLYMARAFFYSAYRDQVLLFYSLTTFVWSGCTCRPTLVHLRATPHHQTKENYFVCLSVVAPFPATVWMPSLSLYLIACT